MENEHSPYRYVDLRPERWAERSDELAAQYITDASKEATDRLFKEIVVELFKYPEDLLKKRRAKHRRNVCVVGGGIAGLTAAYELISHGHSVTVLEAADTLGGRIRTHRFDEHLYGELGAMRIPESHACVNHYVEAFRLRKRTFVSHNRKARLYLRNQKVRLDLREDATEWQRLFDSYGIVDGHHLRPIDPFDSADSLVLQISGDLTLFDLDQIFRHFVIPPDLQLLEQTSVGQMMRGLPVPKRNVRHLTDEEFEFLGRATGMLWFERASLLQFVLNELALKEPRKYELENGMDTLIKAFVEHISKAAKRKEQANILLNTKVKRVRQLDKNVEVLWVSPSGTHTSTYDYVICTTPAGPTTRISFEPPLPPKKYEALTNLSYASAAKTIVRCKTRFWELHDGIYGGGSYTDLPNQQCWYPSDRSGEESMASVKFGLIPEDPQPTDWGPSDAKRSNGPGVFTAAYMWEANARRFAALDTLGRTELILSSVEKVHPGFRAFIENEETDVKHCAWDAESSPGGGAFAFFAPGEQQRYQTHLCEPHFRDATGQARLFFAGEHVAIAHAWIQSAIQSALSVTMHILNAP